MLSDSEITPEYILTKAANLIEINGLAKGDFMDHKGSYCALGAMQESIDSLYGDPDNLSGPAYQAYRDARHQMYLTIGKRPIDKWNDRLWRTKSQVVWHLRKAAKEVSK